METAPQVSLPLENFTLHSLAWGTLNSNKSWPPFYPPRPGLHLRLLGPVLGPALISYCPLLCPSGPSFPRASTGPASASSLLLPSQARGLEVSGLLSGWVGRVGVGAGGRGWGRGLRQQVCLRGCLDAPGVQRNPFPQTGLKGKVSPFPPSVINPNKEVGTGRGPCGWGGGVLTRTWAREQGAWAAFEGQTSGEGQEETLGALLQNSPFLTLLGVLITRARLGIPERG